MKVAHEQWDPIFIDVGKPVEQPPLAKKDQ